MFGIDFDPPQGNPSSCGWRGKCASTKMNFGVFGQMVIIPLCLQKAPHPHGRWAGYHTEVITVSFPADDDTKADVELVPGAADGRKTPDGHDAPFGSGAWETVFGSGQSAPMIGVRRARETWAVWLASRRSFLSDFGGRLKALQPHQVSGGRPRRSKRRRYRKRNSRPARARRPEPFLPDFRPFLPPCRNIQLADCRRHPVDELPTGPPWLIRRHSCRRASPSGVLLIAGPWSSPRALGWPMWKRLKHLHRSGPAVLQPTFSLFFFFANYIDFCARLPRERRELCHRRTEGTPPHPPPVDRWTDCANADYDRLRKETAVRQELVGQSRARLEESGRRWGLLFEDPRAFGRAGRRPTRCA